MNESNKINLILFFLFLMITSLESEFLRDDENGIVLDTSTNLMWQDDASVANQGTYWDNAKQICNDLVLGEFDDWYLPNQDELFNLADRSKFNPALNSVFQNMGDDDNYWTSSLLERDTNHVLRVNFRRGGLYYSGKETFFENSVRCVRILKLQVHQL